MPNFRFGYFAAVALSLRAAPTVTPMGPHPPDGLGRGGEIVIVAD